MDAVAMASPAEQFHATRSQHWLFVRTDLVVEVYPAAPAVPWHV
jgi:hypothetical protein